MQTLTILGGGWLGLELAIQLRNRFNIKISSRTDEKLEIYKKESLEAFVLNEDNFDNLNELLKTDFLFINFPPSKFKDYIAFLEKIYFHKNIKNIKKILFVSSTSIYPSLEKNFTEDYEIKNPSSKIVFEAEEFVKDKTDVILRCAGLMGANRIGGKYYSNKEVGGRDVRVNYVHRDDVISSVEFFLNNDFRGIFNLCCKNHPTREELYLHNAQKYDFLEPIFVEEDILENRIIDGSKIEKLGFKYKYDDPINFN